MAIAFDAKTDGLLQITTGTFTVSHTCTGTQLALFVIVDGRNGDVVVTSCSYNGVALTQAKRVTNATMAGEIWYLLNPATGSNTVSITTTGSAPDWHFYVASFTGVDPTGQPGGSTGGGTGTASSISNTLTSNRVGSLVISGLAHEDSSASTAGQTSLFATDDGLWNSGAQYFITTALGLQTMTWTALSSDTYAHVVAAFQPAHNLSAITVNTRPYPFSPGMAL